MGSDMTPRLMLGSEKTPGPVWRDYFLDLLLRLKGFLSKYTYITPVLPIIAIARPIKLPASLTYENCLKLNIISKSNIYDYYQVKGFL